MDLSSYVSDDIQLVEIYICNSQVFIENKMLEIGWNKDKLNPIITRINNGRDQGQVNKIREYHHRDLCYVYDHENDMQKVYRKTLQKEGCYRNMYISSYIEEILPSHRFPCVDEISYETDIVRTSYRVNNRIHVCYDEDINENTHYLYIKYQHAPNVDLKQMQTDLDKILRKINNKNND